MGGCKLAGLLIAKIERELIGEIVHGKSGI
jgi:hypothetical protein